MANEEETMMTDLLQKNAIPFDDQGQQMYVYLHKNLNQNAKTPLNFFQKSISWFRSSFESSDDSKT